MLIIFRWCHYFIIWCHYFHWCRLLMLWCWYFDAIFFSFRLFSFISLLPRIWYLFAAIFSFFSFILILLNIIILLATTPLLLLRVLILLHTYRCHTHIDYFHFLYYLFLLSFDAMLLMPIIDIVFFIRCCLLFSPATLFSLMLMILRYWWWWCWCFLIFIWLCLYLYFDSLIFSLPLRCYFFLSAIDAAFWYIIIIDAAASCLLP